VVLIPTFPLVVVMLPNEPLRKLPALAVTLPAETFVVRRLLILPLINEPLDANNELVETFVNNTLGIVAVVALKLVAVQLVDSRFETFNELAETFVVSRFVTVLLMKVPFVVSRFETFNELAETFVVSRFEIVQFVSEIFGTVAVVAIKFEMVQLSDMFALVMLIVLLGLIFSSLLPNEPCAYTSAVSRSTSPDRPSTDVPNPVTVAPSATKVTEQA
jgi:hypothetical protein